MGLFGFGKKQKNVDERKEVDEESVSSDSQETFDSSLTERGISCGPWDVNDDNVTDYDDYLDMGALYLPYRKNIEILVKANKVNNEICGVTINLGDSSLEVEAYAAPKSLGLWDTIRDDFRKKSPNATEVDGTFGTELILPVSVKNKILETRIVGIDGPRWMLRGIFSGNAVHDSDDKTELDNYFSKIVVDRGDVPLAPRDLIPMHVPVQPSERVDQGEDGESASIPDEPEGPFDSDQQTEVKTTLSRGPMFSEVR